MKQYHDLLQRILDEGDEINTERTGVGTIALFGEQLKFDLRKGFPAITTKKLAWKSVVSELIWFLKGSDNLYDLRAILYGENNRFNDEKRTIWDDNYNKQAKDLGYTDGFMGDIYGSQWRGFGRCLTQATYTDKWDNDEHIPWEIKGIDQINWVIGEATKNPQSRRLIVNAWNPLSALGEYTNDFVLYDQPALQPCHMMFQLNVVGEYIDLQWNQRSADVFLGIPFNIASYGLLLHIFARILGKTPRYLSGALGNVHIYKNHVEQVKEQLTRVHFDNPTLWMNKNLKTLEDFENASVNDFKLIGYEHHATIKAPMAV